MKSNWKPVTSSIPQVTILGPILLNFFIENLDDEAEWAECTFSKFACDTKLGLVADTPESCASIQTDLNR